MPTDAKFGLVVGVGTVLLIAAIFFRRDPAAAEGAQAAVVPPQPTANAVAAPAEFGGIPVNPAPRDE